MEKLAHQPRVQITSVERLNLIKVLPKGCKTETGSDYYEVLNRFRMALGESMNSQKLPDNFLPSPLGIGESHGQAVQAHQS
jgi:hypothetical protein